MEACVVNQSDRILDINGVSGIQVLDTSCSSEDAGGLGNEREFVLQAAASAGDGEMGSSYAHDARVREALQKAVHSFGVLDEHDQTNATSTAAPNAAKATPLALPLNINPMPLDLHPLPHRIHRSMRPLPPCIHSLSPGTHPLTKEAVEIQSRHPSCGRPSQHNEIHEIQVFNGQVVLPSP